MNAREWMLLSALALLWGVPFYFVEIALTALPPVTIVALRVSLGAIALIAWLIARGILWREFTDWKGILRRWKIYLLLGGIGSATPFTLFSWGQQYIDSGLAGTLNACFPLFSIVLAAVVGEERFSFARALGIAAGIGGISLLLAPTFSGDINAGLGASAAAMTGFFYAVSAIAARRHLSGFPPAENAVGFLVGASVLLYPIAFVFERPLESSPDAKVIGVILCFAVFSTTLAYLIYFRLIALVGATGTALVTFLIPIVAVLLGVFALDEKFGADFFLGALLIFAGLVLADSKLRLRIASILFRRRH